jgi:pyridinium-3,5-biscarboxylic acid mononucleotide synthase
MCCRPVAVDIRALLEDLAAGRASVDDAVRRIARAPYESLTDENGVFARVDHHRALVQGMAEVIYGEGKTPAHVASVCTALLDKGANVLVTRTNADAYAAVRAVHDDAIHHESARCITVTRHAPARLGSAALLAAGTSDLPVLVEVEVCARMFGIETERFVDVGVAGLHRILAVREKIDAHDVVVVVAGMEGALPSVVAGLTRKPVIAVPTSVGYGTSFGGVAALLSMLNACSSGIVVVNIDNGFGAAAAMRRLLG